ncbi:uncharacterized membrane protein YhaH (DUF805 family) [Caulobacter sp. BK020]|nr:uncharacterized membrane protein YhaH (DUF805 family) [Caulobacter sp. BK020]
MGGFKLLLSPAGIGRRAFGWSALALYGLPLALAATNLLLLKTLGENLVTATLGTILFGAVVLVPYVGLCLHLKRLRDAGRPPWSLISLSLLTLLGTPLALLLPSLRLMFQNGPGVEGSDTMMFAAMALGAAAILAWPFYSLWVGLAGPRADEIATQVKPAS